MPKKVHEHVKLVAYIPEALAKSIKHEAVDRNLTIGKLVEEAFATRVIFTSRSQESQSR